MKVRLIDIDATGFPNLALMQISTWYRAHGHEVGFGVPDPDLVYLSCVFSWNAEMARGIATMFPEATIILGGSGLNTSWLPDKMQKVMPDYDLYGQPFSMGFTTRGCIRACPWCVVPRKEGPFRHWQHVSEFTDPRWETVRLLDNNILADPEWFLENTNYILEHELRIDINQGMDVRLLTPEICTRLKQLKWAGPKRIAFDSLGYADDLQTGIKMMRDAGIRVHRSTVQCYVLVGFDTTPQEDIERLRILKELDVQPFVMQFEKTPWTRRVAWWSRPPVFWKCDIAELDRQRYRGDHAIV